MTALLTILGAIGAGLVVHAVLDVVLRHTRVGGEGPPGQWWREGVRGPSRLVIVLLVALVALPLAGLSAEAAPWVRRWIAAGLVASTAWLAVRLMEVAAEVVEGRHRTDVEDNLQARRVHTRVRMLRRIGATAVALLAGALILTLFPPVRELGVSLFASAGVVGIVLGIAARPTLSSLIAGIQVALTEPIRLDDVVIVDGEWGRVEEINMTFVVVRIWDDRRLVVPLSRFIDESFENWTRKTADLLGTVFVHTDYTIDVERARQTLFAILDDEELWDGRARGLQVTGASERTVELRALLSAASAPDAWTLRCNVRERFIAALREEQPDALPRLRVATPDNGASRNGGMSDAGAGRTERAPGIETRRHTREGSIT